MHLRQAHSARVAVAEFLAVGGFQGGEFILSCLARRGRVRLERRTQRLESL